MRVLFLASEVAPYSKSGGLADVGGALPAALRRLGTDVLTVTPRYGEVPTEGLRPLLEPQTLTLGTRRVTWSARLDPDTSTAFVEAPELYERDSIYTQDPDEHLRFAAFAVAALEIARRQGWRPDVVHCNDWQTGTVPALLDGPYAEDPVLGGVPAVLTIHNLGYQGWFGAEAAGELGLDGHEHLLLRRREGAFSFLVNGLARADLITTVSPTYAREVQTPDDGFGLDGLLRARSDRLVGILNGIDDAVWNPRTDPLIPWRYSVKSLWRKERDKEALLGHVGLPYRPDVPVAGMISRLVYQKGIELMPGPLLHFLDTWDLRVVVLGSGEGKYEEFFRWLQRRHPDKMAFVPGYDVPLSHLIEAGADIYLMPSRYEPCGLNQMYSLAYGTMPVVRRTGGLADTVTQFDAATGTGTGILFDHFTEDGLGWALGQALTLHLDRKSWRIAQANGMEVDNSWRRRAGDYLDVYRSLAGE